MYRFVVTGFVLSGLVGCSGADDADSAASVGASSSHPAARVAHEFLTAVIEGDTTTATNRLTPRAIEQFRGAGKRFAPPGLDSATFRIGEVREPSAGRALVQCVLTSQGEGGGESEEMCCMMRLEGRDWRVSGIAYDAGGAEPIILDFEDFNRPPPSSPQQFAERPGVAEAPRTAQNPGVERVQ